MNIVKRTYRTWLIVALLWAAIAPTRSIAQGALPCPPVDVNRADVINNVTSSLGNFTFSTITDFQNGITSTINLYINAKGGKNYAIRYRFLNGANPVLANSGNSISPTNAFRGSASFGAAGWGTLNVQIPNTNVMLTSSWSTLATFKARCAVTNANLAVSFSALGTNAGVNNFFVRGSTPPLSYGNVAVEFQLVNLDNPAAIPDAKSTPFEILIGDVLSFTLNNNNTTITATPLQYINGIEVTAADQLVVTCNNTYDVGVSAASNTLAASGGGAVGTISFSDVSLRVANTVPNMGTTFNRVLSTAAQTLSVGALQGWLKPVSLTYRLQNPNPRNINPGTYSGVIYISVTEN